MSTIAQVCDRAILIATAQSGVTTPRLDNDYIAQLLYPMAMKKVVIEAGRDRSRQKDVRLTQNITVSAGVGVLPSNVVLECLESATVSLMPSAATLTASNITAASDLVTLTNHGYWTGMPFVMSGSSGLAGLTLGTTYYAVYVSSSTFKIATSVANALAGTVVDLTTASATNTLTPSFTRGSVSYVPTYFDYIRALPSPFCYWTVKEQDFFFTPAGAANTISCGGTIPLDAVCYPIINGGYVQMAAGTDLAEDIVDDIVRELASVIRQEILVKEVEAAA